MMRLSYCNILKKNFAWIICLLLVAIATEISHLKFTDFLKFVLIQYLCIYIPGHALHRILRLKENNCLSCNLSSYALGYSLTILIYLILLIIGISKLVLFFYLIISALSIIYLFGRKKAQIFVDNLGKDQFSFGIILFIATLFGTVMFQYENLSPFLQKGNIAYNQDLVFWFRNCVAATKSYPLPDLSVMGNKFFYHYFTSIEIGFLHFMTGIEIFDLCFTYSYLITIFLFVSGLYFLLNELITNEKLKVIALCFILFTSSIERFTHIYFSPHIYKVPFGLPEGLAYFCFAFTYYTRWFRQGGSNLVLAFTFILFLSICTGLKGPVASILIVGVGVGCLLLIKKGNFWKVSTMGIFSLLVFILILGFFVTGTKTAEDGSSYSLSISPFDTLFHSHYFERIYFKLMSIIPMTLFAYLVTMLLFLLSSMLIPIIVLYMGLKNREHRLDDIYYILIVMAFCGILLCVFISQNGMSQMYFLFISIICIFILGFSIYSSKREFSKSNFRTIYIIFLGGFFLFLIQAIPLASHGVKLLLTDCSIVQSTSNKLEESGTTLNKGEVLGLRWVRDNLPQNIILLSNKVLGESGARSFITSSFSERQTFFESYDYSILDKATFKNRIGNVRSFYYGNNNTSNILKKRGVTHAIVYKNIKPNIYPTNCKLIFENKELIVVEL